MLTLCGWWFKSMMLFIYGVILVRAPPPWPRAGTLFPWLDVMSDMSRADRQRLQLFFALFFGTAGCLLSVFSCGTEYWLLASRSCGRTEPGSGTKALFQPDVEVGWAGSVRPSPFGFWLVWGWSMRPSGWMFKNQQNFANVLILVNLS